MGGSKKRICLRALIVAGMVLLLMGCSSSRHVPQGSYLLDKVVIETDSSSRRLTAAEVAELSTYLRQQPNHKMLWSMRLRLGVYNMSGRDSTKWWNRWVRKLGEPPVLYDSLLTDAGREQLKRVYMNRGFLSADVKVDTMKNDAKKKIKVRYEINPGQAHILSRINYEFNNDSIRELVMADSALFPVEAGMPLDVNLLDSQREIITRRLRNRGYYNFGKEFITFSADTTSGSVETELTMKIEVPERVVKEKKEVHPDAVYVIRNVYVLTDFNPSLTAEERAALECDTVRHADIDIIYGERRYLRPNVITDNCFLRPGQIFRQRDVDRTYQAFSRLGILKFISVKFEENGAIDKTAFLDAYILLTPGKSQIISAELDGTNSEGDLGVAVGLNYSHFNIGRGSETLSLRLRGAYESLSGNLDGLIHNRYMDLSAETALTFPKFKAPFLKDSFKRKINATTEFNVSINYQERPEYSRIISTAGWSYKWSERRTGNRHTFTPIDINYVYLPESTNEFLNQIAPDNPLLRYSYEDHFIMRLGYSFYHTNKHRASTYKTFIPNIYTIRVNAEIAGNLLFALSNIFDHRSNFREHPYKVFGTNYSQYFKVDADYSFTHFFDRRNSLAFHTGLGVAYPYGNSSILPFEKRFYGGGANGVRGWAVRTLGPGCFPGRNSVSDFMDQCGDIRLDLSVEYRAKLFWVLELGVFVDAGNIWTIKDYVNQPGGLFSFRKFYKEIAAAYGLGIRLDFNYFLIRCDLGMKAHNPAIGEESWPLIHPDWRRDHSFHFSIGYPF